MNRSTGHAYRFGFAVVTWCVLFVLVIWGEPSRIVLFSTALLAASFSIFVFVVWMADQRQAK